ncbi:MAG: hypothetical protein A2136_02915 [Chloroflexi bacterium RBG_16_54_11]|nr:MAG: hypothetical protein A2136_02915 [Chloroflexi bacterium RBG_16_54_11]
MDPFTERISRHSIVCLDTTVFIYHFESNPAYLPLTHALFTLIESGRLRAVTSTSTLLEIIVRPLSMGREDIARKYEALLVNFPHLDILDLDRDVMRQAARLRAQYHLRPPDALQVSACLLGGATAFATNDRHLERIKDQLDIVILEDFVNT